MVPGIPVMKGCPDPDRDNDTVVDRLDNCPDEPGPVENQGCKLKQLVKIVEGKLEILDIVYFALNQAVIERRSYKLLDEVARVINAHPEITKLRVEGHTDSQGNDEQEAVPAPIRGGDGVPDQEGSCRGGSTPRALARRSRRPPTRPRKAGRPTAASSSRSSVVSACR